MPSNFERDVANTMLDAADSRTAHEKTRIRQLEDAAAHWEHKYTNARQYNRNLEARIAALEARCRAEEEAHAELQSRCFDYGGTFQNVFDDLKASKARVAELEAALLISIEDYEAHNGRPKAPHWAATSRLLLTPLETPAERCKHGVWAADHCYACAGETKGE